MSADQQKALLRKEIRAVRKQAFQEKGAEAAQILSRHVMAVLENRPSSILAGYRAVGSEMDIDPVLTAMAEEGWKVGLPVVVGANTPLIFRRWFPGDVLDEGPLQTLQPQSASEKLNPEIVLVPLLAFDGDRYRLGQGGGFYDRTLADLKDQDGGVLSIGVAFACQQVESVPRDQYDQQLDMVITENGVL